MDNDLQASAPPLRRDWTGWLFLLLASLAIAAVLCVIDSNAEGVPRAGGSPHIAPPANVIPAVPPMELAPVTIEDARALNAEIPFVTAKLVTAKPFTFSGDADNRARARDCLAAAMLYEAGDDTKGQRAVAQVIINRARHPAFPKTICGVVFQGSDRATGCQFSFTCDGALNRHYSDAAWQRARSAANLALSGNIDPAVGLATHYHTDWVRPYWSDNLDKIAAVETHLFFRWPGYWGTPAAYRGTITGIEPAIDKMAALSPAHAELIAGNDAASIAKVALGTPRIVAGAGNAVNRQSIFVVLDRKASPESYVLLALRLCGQRQYCKFMGWTNPIFKPDGETMSDAARNAMSFSYLHDESAGFEKALWNCSEFDRDDKRQCMKR